MHLYNSYSRIIWKCLTSHSTFSSLVISSIVGGGDKLCFKIATSPFRWFIVEKISLSKWWWKCFQLCYSLLYIVYWTSIKVYLWVHHQWRPIGNMRANVSPCPFNITVLLHIKLFSSINTDVVCQEKWQKGGQITNNSDFHALLLIF